MFVYNVMSEQEAMAERYQLLKEGIYEGVITASSDSQSKTGNSMMTMVVTVYDEKGKKYEIRDFLVFTSSMMWKVIHFADCAGLIKEYESGKLCSQEAINSSVKVKIGVEPGKEIPQDNLNGKPVGSRYPDKNKIEDYVKKEEGNKSTTIPGQKISLPSDGVILDDDVPF